MDLSKLNKEQKEAVVFGEGPLLIVAGAGTGKTTVITQRIAYLISSEKASPEEILGLTFTDKAAGEMEERVDRLLEIGYIDLWVSTFHAFCERVLREEGLDIGLSTDFKLLDQTSAWLLMRKNLSLFELDYYRPLGNPTKFLHALISHFSRCKDQGIYPEDYLDYADSLKSNLTDLKEDTEGERVKEIASAFHVYQKLLLDNNFLDFGDLINYCLKLFQKRSRILEKYRNKFKYILVDEFQDTNFSQYELVKLLAAPNNNLTVCADDFQAIYRFRGASYRNIVQFKKDFPKVKEVSLVQNYRSAQNILDLAYLFIKDNDPDRMKYFKEIDKKLKSSFSEKGIIEHFYFKNLDEEAQGAANKIIEILKEDKTSSFSDFAILVRANNTANPFCLALERKGIPFQFLASRGLYAKPVILDALSYFKLLDNYHESSAVFRILNLPFLNIPQDDIMNINQYAKKKAKSVYEVLLEVPSLKSKEKINFIVSLIKKHSLLTQKRKVSEIFLRFLRDSGYLKYLTSKEDKISLDHLGLFYRKLKDFEESSIDPVLKNFMEEMNLELESGELGKLQFDLEKGPDMVKVMTIHAAKGLEFKYVFLVSMVDRRFPTTERKDPIEIPEKLQKEEIPEGDIHLKEERRLCYVSMTRAKKGLFFTSAEDYGGQRKKKLSRFLIEMGFKEKEKEKLKKLERISAKKEERIALPSYFSFSQLAAFQKCPLQYKYAYLLKIPVHGKAVFSFGQTMHSALYEFVKKENEIFSQSDLFGAKEKKALSLEDLEEIYKEKWIDEWYEDEAQKKEYYKLGERIIKDFYQVFQKNPPSILKIDGELALEKPFKLKLKDYLILGRIDRIDKADKGVKIVDYKTGSYKEKLFDEDKQQLLIYQIAAEEVFKVQPSQLSYYYLNEGKETTFLGSEKEKQEQKEKMLKQIEEMKKSDFSATPGFHCKFCDFKDICDFAQL